MATWLSLLAASTATEDDLSNRFCRQAFGGCRFARSWMTRSTTPGARRKRRLSAGRGFSARGKRDGERVRLGKPGEFARKYGEAHTESVGT
ncbi:hypothetical protein PR202_gb27212 [Eleusine coracana subsp. coracana]|uniref:Secreted protein n=1 Tax=Eleusine coracana subsp. coracana TaxID=191504 RepID=A0AAV5FT68_ELECO|nr:hypothetical protein PR202_gb27212 [Eleusine coracana subsp. coracana]